MEMPGQIKLFCLIIGHNQSFAITTSSTSFIFELKQLIREVPINLLQGVDFPMLTLWRPKDTVLMDSYMTFAEHLKTPASPSQLAYKLNEADLVQNAFQDQIQTHTQTLHILVEIPAGGGGSPTLDKIAKLFATPKTDKDEHYQFRNTLTIPDAPVGQMKAIENAWTTEYRGEAPAALWTEIKTVMKKADRYANYLPIVQSSGTGKSRMIEELSKMHFVIPVNLRDSHDTGYPPSDKTARAYLPEAISRQEARVHAVAFLRAIFKEVSELITELRERLSEDNQIAGLFSEYMSDGMRWREHGSKRQSFFEKVKLGASKLEGEIKENFAKHSKSSLDVQLASVGICEDFEGLILALSSARRRDRTDSTRRMSSSRSQVNQEPLVILAFDEAHNIAQFHDDGLWSHLSELCRALRALKDQPLFSLFLTTTGNVNSNVIAPTSRRLEDLSGRIQSEKFSACHPFTEVGFDQFAIKDQFNLRTVAGDEHISHFGRPLWATRYREGEPAIKSRIIEFAAFKLRAGRDNWPAESLNAKEKLVCLSQRLPIEFHSITHASKMKEFELVEGHMRILLRLDAGFESLTTVSASEPLLSEAAYWMMYPDTEFQAAETLTRCLDGYAIHKGDRGELLVMLLFTLARDCAIGRPDEIGRPKCGRRWCSVPNFMNNLFKFECDSPSGDVSLKTLFANSKIFFNHWIKVYEHEMMNVQYLAQLMRRGAAVLCATKQPGIDGIIPFLRAGYTIFPNNIGVILWRVENDLKYTDKPDPRLFKVMDPYALDILSPADDIHIIRIVFALASPTPCLTRVTCQEDGFKSCDFWVGGISPIVFSPVRDNDARNWNALLQASYGWEDIYKKTPDGKMAKNVGRRRSMNPGTAENDCHWENWACFTTMDEIKEIKEDEKDGNEEADGIMDEADEKDGNDKEDERMDEDWTA